MSAIRKMQIKKNYNQIVYIHWIAESKKAEKQ